MRPRNSTGSGLLVLALAVGCSPAARGPEIDVPTPRAEAAESVAKTSPAESLKSPAGAADIALDPGGFSIRESTILAEDVRIDYDDAVRMLEQGRTGVAIDRLSELSERAPDATAVHIALGMAHARVDELDAAETSLMRALELSPQHPVACNELGLVLRRQGRFEEARESYETALARFADFHYAHRNLGILCDLYLGDPACALEHYETYGRLVPDDDEVGRWIADLRMRANRQENP